MKKLLNVLVLIVLFSSLFIVLAATTSPQPSTGVEAGDKENFDNAVENIPIDDSGNFNGSKFEPLKSKAEMRIDAINKWLEDNAPWLSIIVGITPQISWLFALNFYFMLLFLVILVLNSSRTLGFLSRGKEWIFGLILYLILLITKFYVMLAKIVLNLIKTLWEVSWVVGILVVIGLIILFAFAPKGLYLIGKLFRKSESKEEIEKVRNIRKEEEARVRAIRGN